MYEGVALCIQFAVNFNVLHNVYRNLNRSEIIFSKNTLPIPPFYSIEYLGIIMDYLFFFRNCNPFPITFLITSVPPEELLGFLWEMD